MSVGEEFRAAWPQVVRNLAVTTRSLDLGEEYAAEAFARAAAQPDGSIDDLAAWCVAVGKRAWLDDTRRDRVLDRLRPEIARPETQPETTDDMASSPGDALDDRLALLFVACDEQLAPGAQLVLAMRVVCGLSTQQIARHLGIADATAAGPRPPPPAPPARGGGWGVGGGRPPPPRAPPRGPPAPRAGAGRPRPPPALARARGEFVVPGTAERAARLPVVLACVAGLFTVGQREVLAPADPTEDPARDALVLAEALAAEYADDPEAVGLRAVCRIGLARRPGRVRDGVALPLDESDRSAWDVPLLRAGLDDAAFAAERSGSPGRFTLEAAISGLHATAPSPEQTDWPRLASFYDALVARWPSPSAHVARLVVRCRLALAGSGSLAEVERDLEALVTDGPSYAARDANFALADLAHRTGRHEEAAARYRELAEVVPDGPVREFCPRRAR